MSEKEPIISSRRIEQLKVNIHLARLRGQPGTYQQIGDHFGLSVSYVGELVNGLYQSAHALTWFEKFEEYVEELLKEELN